MGTWQITYGGVTQDAAAWGICKLTRQRRSAAIDVAGFSLDGEAVDTNPLPFPCKLSTLPACTIPVLSITRNGVQWFYGWVTKPQPQASGKAESIAYEISGPWYWLEKTIFQQQWFSVDPTGDATTLIPTTQSNIILNQSLDGVKMNSGMVMMDVLIYAQYAFQGLPFPSTCDANGVATPVPNPANGALPFQIGVITPNIIVPYAEVRDKSCADIIRLLLKYTPDAITWMDYSTTPPTLNIDRRGNLGGKTISTLGGGNGPAVTDFKPTPRYDLQVPAVIAKFQQTNSRSGQSYTIITVDNYPPTVPDNAPRAWVQTIDLVGGQITIQTADFVVKARPINITDPGARAWILYKLPWLTALGPNISGMEGEYNLPQYDSANVALVYLDTAIDPTDPLNTSNPNNVPLPDCHNLVNELITGNQADWLQESQSIDTAKVLITAWLTYSGTDPKTAALFWYDPTNPSVAKTDGSGYLRYQFNTKVTNASTTTYSEVTSDNAAEPVPVGFAEYLYNALAPLHFEGKLTLTEPECSDQLPIGCIFNTTDGNPDWKTMNALVLSVAEDIDKGITTVNFGPPLMLGLQELEALFRANLGRLPSFKLDQRTTGQTGAGASVQGNTHAADTNTVKPEMPLLSSSPPYTCSGVSVGATPMIAVTPGTHNGTQATGSPLTVGAGTGTVYVQVDFTYDALNNVTIVDNELKTTTGTVPASTITPGGSGGSGTLYQPIATYTATVSGATAKVTCSPLIGGSQNFGVCGGAISMPWGV